MSEPVVLQKPAEQSTDPDAPYGRRPDGTPYKRSPEFRAAAYERLKEGRDIQARRRAQGLPPGQPPAPPAEADREPDRPADDGQVFTLPRIERGEDRPPGQHGKKPRSAGPGAPEPDPVPAFRAGPIAKGMNRLYLRVGKIVRAMDREIGQAIIETTRKESDDDTTVGEAWEELARVNPKARVILLKIIAGGVWGQLFMAHAPILLAIVLKPQIAARIPFQRFMQSWLQPDYPDDSNMMAGQAGMTEAGLQDMFAFAQGLMSGTMTRGMQFPPDREPRMDDAA